MPSHAPRRLVAAATTTAAVCALALTPFAAASAAIVPDPIVYSADDATLSLTPLGTFETGAFEKGAAEIVAAHGDRLFVVNAQAGSVSVLDYSAPSAIAKEFDLSSAGVANSVAVRADGLGVVAFEAPVKTDPGTLVFFDAAAADAESAVLGTITVGALPDMVTFSKDGAYAVVANEGEPAEDFSEDPEGSIAVVALPSTVAAPTQDAVETATFHEFEAGGAKTLHEDVRVFGPTPHGDDNPVSRNLEPEYIAVDGGTAYATLQEANAVAVVDLATATVSDIWPLGFKDHGAEGYGLDASDSDPEDAPTFNIRTYPGLKGMYMPDGIQSYEAGGQTYLVTANEGDAREWGDYIDESRVEELADDGQGPVCESLLDVIGDADLGRLNVSKEDGFDPEAECYFELYSYGGRSFSIWSTDGERVFDSGESFERITHAAAPANFNSDHGASDLESRSDAKGPEAENVAIGTLSGRTYAFVGFERVSGIAVYDITDPAASAFVTYVNNRDFSVSAEDDGVATAGDLGPEGLAFIAAESSATGEPLLAVGNEVSGTTTLWEIDDLLAPETTDIQVLTINDFHGRIEQNLDNAEAGAAVLAGAVDAFEAENPNTLFVSAGDNIGASTFTSFIQDDEPTIDALVAAGLDLGAVGNHEFDQGFDDLTDRVLPRYGDTDFGLGANVYLKGTDTPALPEYAIEEIDGVRIGFIGTVTEQTASMVSPAGIADIEFGDQLEAANRVATELTEQDLADVIVLLTHEGSETSDCTAVSADATGYGELIRGASPEIEAIVSGHTHQKYSCRVPVDGSDVERPVIQAHQYGTTLGTLDISVDSETRELVSITGGLVPLVVDGAAAFPEDAEVKAIVDEAIDVAEEAGSVEVGSITADILRGGTAGSDRGVESALGNLVADVYLWATSNEDYAGTPAEIGLMNPGGLRADLLYGTDGTLTYRDVANVQPFANSLVTVTLTGEQLRAVLEEQWQPEGASRPKLHLGVSEGFSYEYDPEAARGERIVSMSLNGEEIAATDEYTVVTNSFLAGGGDNFFTFADGTDRTDTGQIDLAATVQYFEAHSPVAPAELGRAVVAGDQQPTPSPTPVTDWATVDVGSGTVEQGGSLPVKVSGLEPGQQISATLFSDPIVVSGIPAADASGNVSFTVRIPSNLPVGAHTLVIESAGHEPIEVGVTVVAPGQLAVTGAQLPLGLALAAALLVVLGGAFLVMRRRSAARG
ncbi:choice-of-anchor I family protein [Microbacterium sp. CPCC 204701]|uniref:choice-of-anchor I family protein n=1 Tax=Microbacterium sp. CPCC 204701 TaxID=2493084 RepID=UPI000FDA7F12|nr:choice-of-anchor I family protein [Microbacterium sp. CPCC 204701]